MANFIFTIDTGTTNTRVFLWEENRRLVDARKRAVGVRDTAVDGNSSRLKQAVRDCLNELSAAHGVRPEDTLAVLASGMITSNVGLAEIPHIAAPADLAALAAATRRIRLEEISPVPIWFIPGVKNFSDPVTLENFETMDIMRGEETESLAVMEKYFDGGPMLLILPGSHTKFVSVNSKKQITGCLTSITGELLSAITCNTVLADTVEKKFIEDASVYDRELMLLGYRTAKRCGLGRAAFSARILKLFALRDPYQAANYLLGAVLQNDVLAVRNSGAVQSGPDTRTVIVGKYPFGPALCDILKAENCFRHVIFEAADPEVPLSSLGALLIAEEKGIL